MVVLITFLLDSSSLFLISFYRIIRNCGKDQIDDIIGHLPEESCCWSSVDKMNRAIARIMIIFHLSWIIHQNVTTDCQHRQMHYRVLLGQHVGHHKTSKLHLSVYYLINIIINKLIKKNIIEMTNIILIIF